MSLERYPSSVSIGTMIVRLEGLVGCSQLDDADEEFVCGMVDARDAGQVTRLTQAQIDRVQRLHDRHFAG